MARKAMESVRVCVRLAGPGDSLPIALLSEQLGYPASREEVKQRLGQIRRQENSAVFVAEQPQGGVRRVVGWVQVSARKLVVAEKQAEIEGLVVDESLRRCGVGRMLTREAERWARLKGCEVVSLRSNIVRREARPFYEGLGYSVVKTQWTFRKVLKTKQTRQKKSHEIRPVC